MAKENGSPQSPADAAKAKLEKAREKFNALGKAEQGKIVLPLIKNYDAANVKLNAARAATDKAMAERSEIVRQLAEVGFVGMKRNGKDMIVQSRKSKDDPEGAPTWFFRGEKESTLVEY